MKKNNLLTSLSFIFILLLISKNSFGKNLFPEDISLGAILNMDIEVASKGKKMAAREAPSIISVISDYEIKQMGAKNLSEILNTIPGFDLTMNPIEQNPVVSIRGFSSMNNENVRLLLNGHPIGNSWINALGYWEAFPVDLIKKIEIIRGPGSALYGNNAMLGVINIITKDSDSDPEVRLSYGSFDAMRGTGALNIKDERVDVFIFFDKYKGDGDSNQVESDYMNYIFDPIVQLLPGQPTVSAAPGNTDEGFDYTNIFAKVTFDNFYLNGMLNHNRTENPLSYSFALCENDWRTHDNSMVEMGYQGDINSSVFLTTRIYYDYFKWRYLNVVSLDTTRFVTNYLNMGYPDGEMAGSLVGNENYKTGGEMTLQWELRSGVQLTGGAQYEKHKMFGPFYFNNISQTGEPININGKIYPYLHYLDGWQNMIDTYPAFASEARREIVSFYSEIKLDFVELFPTIIKVESLAITAGLRYDDYDDIGDTINPRLGMVFAPTSMVYTKLLYGEAYRAPNFRELYTMNNSVQNGNPELKSETLKTMEALLGIVPNKSINILMSCFYSKFEDMIFIMKDEGKFGVSNHNIGSLKAYGAEAELKIAFDKQRYGYINVTWQQVINTTRQKITDKLGTVYQQEEFDQGNIPEWMANIGINTGISKHINFNCSLSYRGKRERSEEMQFTVSSLDADGSFERLDKRDSIDESFLLNASIIFGNFEFLKGLEIQLTGNNLLDDDIRSPETRGFVKNDIPLWGSHYLATVTYTF
ncbi:MAG: TonB-dependent receptor [Desulfobacterales bacterium]|nr:TonB-dependent receptor [Desulfobacterales bacterium]